MISSNIKPYHGGGVLMIFRTIVKEIKRSFLLSYDEYIERRTHRNNNLYTYKKSYINHFTLNYQTPFSIW